MSKKQSWLLMSAQEIASILQGMREAGDTTLYRQQKAYYKRTQNTVMLGRLEAAETLLGAV